MKPEVAVVIPTCRRPALLRRCLEAVLGQTLEPGRYEVIVVDDGHDEACRAAVLRMAARTGAPTLRYLRPQDTRGPAAARNRGWRDSEAPIIAFTDDDTIPDPGWLQAGVAALTPDCAAAAGRVVVPVDGRPTDHARMTRGLESAEFVTANVFVRRVALARIGGFDERFTRAWREDSDLHFSLLESGERLARAPQAVVAHPVRPARWGVSLGQQKNVCFDALLYRKHRSLFRQKVRRRPPWLYLTIVAATIAAAAAWAAGRHGLAAASVFVAVSGMAVFAARRLRGASRAPGHVAEMLVTSMAIPFLALFWRAVGAWRFRTLFP